MNLGGDTITATVEFSFQGKHYKLVVKLEVAYLTKLLENGNEGAIYRIIASKGGLDTYSYAYEAMEMQPVHFSDSTGLISRFIEDGKLDSPAYLQACREAASAAGDPLLAQIAHEHMHIVDLDGHPELKNALKAAYQAGKTGTVI
ncbi:hypothetical protein [Thiothrix nivea]|uniref:Uncharacterized protein n=1 Tax=Thiothrix nivea (strain ATCC 35100 / DSM 5205 / JP2) TaxID=870187 RepID=A0A656HCR4_THINJ|nr:hypothetical protein [Thiothrix nivea]EIJ33962.1 hypothetical protein Thini_1350 [Thiothrix nivea DSM 5205]